MPSTPDYAQDTAQDAAQDADMVRRFLSVFESFTTIVCNNSAAQDQVLPYLQQDEQLKFLNMSRDMLCSVGLSRMSPSALATLIEVTCKQHWILQAEIISALEPNLKRNVAAQLSEETTTRIPEVLGILQKIAELEFTKDGEFIPDVYIVTGEWPAQFPERLRTCSVCQSAYKLFDGVEVVDESCERSQHEDESCP